MERPLWQQRTRRFYNNATGGRGAGYAWRDTNGNNGITHAVRAAYASIHRLAVR